MENNLPQTPTNSTVTSPQQATQQQTTAPQKSSLPMILGGLALLLLGLGGGYYLGTQQTSDKVSENASAPIVAAPAPVMNDPETLPTSVETSPSPATTIALKKFSSGSEFFKFSVMAPADSTTMFPPTAGRGGLFLKNDKYPYGLITEYTALTDQSAREGLYKEEYARAVPADINIGGKETVMLKGIETTSAPTGFGPPGEIDSEEKEYAYTKYLFRDGELVYLVSIQTDKNLTNYETLKAVAKSWKFE